ncbi:MAG TPA: hypothetical protein VF334_19435 [Polyangia bacterium]
MPLVQCTGCKRFVLPKSDDSCPSCGAATSGARSVTVAPMDVAEAAAWRRHDEEKREREAMAAALHRRGQTLSTAGGLLAMAALLVSIGSFVAAAAGGMYVVWSGGLVGGVAMWLRGRSLLDRARRLDAG